MSHTREPGIYLKGRYICRECTKREAFSVLWPCGPSEYQRGREDAAEAVDDMLFSDARATMLRRDFLARVRGDGERA